MANPDDSESLTWGTLEELLLACAVHRYGTDCWDSVAKEIQKRSSGTFHLFTSQGCKQKYYDLKRRFAAQTEYSGSGGRAAEEDGGADAFPWLDELRRRRIADLKRELERYDLSIVSLQSTVRRLSEQREKSLTENAREVSDLQKTEQKEEEGNRTGTPSPPLPESGADDGAPADESDRENHSVNASNTSDPKGEKSGENGDEVAGEKNPVELAADSSADPEEATDKPAGEDSYNGSSDTIAAEKGPAGSQDLGSVKTEPVCDSPELVESVAESKREEEEERMEKETSEVQSSASLSDKEGRGKTIGLSNSGEEAENQSAAAKPASVKSQSMADFLDVIRRHKFGSVFERRLDSQESSKYKNMIRQHLDLATVKARLEEGQYAECPSKFYRDLLLLATNAALFFPKRAPEHKAAIHLRQIVSTKLPQHPSTPAELPAPPPPAPTTQQAQPNPELETPDQAPAEPTPVLKPKLLNAVIVCRKRSLVVMKPSSGEKKRADSSSNTNDEKEKGKDKLASGGKGAQLEKLAWFGAVTNKRTMDQSAGSRSSGPKLPGNKSSSDAPSSKEGSGDETATAKLQKKKNDKDNNQDNNSNAGSSVRGKKCLANFLNRIRRSAADPSDSLKSSPNLNSKTNSKGGGEVRKNGGGNSGKGSKSEAPSKGSSPVSVKEKGKQKEVTNDEGSKRNVGRPPKRVAAMAGAVKRRRVGGGDKAEGAAPKKRSRK